ncbi:MAG: hypothetical protein JRI23_14865, partial [Deltaproteobacteria bacterium]|nr:hypothetical protein [Deltaproteobacteria bacterium]MBW2533031.1 hypothetical protein [Deltaproteobacteria bacterium]
MNTKQEHEITEDCCAETADESREEPGGGEKSDRSVSISSIRSSFLGAL